MRQALTFVGLFLLLGAVSAAAEVPVYQEVPFFESQVKDGSLPAIAQRLPAAPGVAGFEWPGQVPGNYGGELTMLMSSAKDTRYLVTYGYAQLVVYDAQYKLVPNILESFDVEEGRIFTFHLRPGQKWSDGSAFTSEDFRFFWEDIANNPELSPAGPPADMIHDGEPAKVEVIDKTTIRYSWSKPNANFLPALALRPDFFIYSPSKYLKKLHKKYAKPDELAALVKDSGSRSWAQLFNRRNNPYKNDNPKMPTLGPWVLKTKPPADRFVFERNPYYFRVDPQGHQLPYIDKVVFFVADGKLIPAKAGAGESMLQAKDIRFADYTFLKEGEKSGGYRVVLWKTGNGSSFTLFPDLTTSDPVWRKLMRDVRFRRALSLSINRHEINQVIYYGLAREGANSVLPESPLYKPEFQQAYAAFDIAAANKLLDEVGLTKRDEDGFRLLPDGRQMTIIVDTAGAVPEESDVLELIRDSWAQAGIHLFTKPFVRDVFRNRVFAGDSIMSVWTGLENGLPTASFSPSELAPVDQNDLEWPKWGQYHETHGMSGEAPDMPEVKQLLDLLDQWGVATDDAARTDAWEKMLSIYTDQVYTIGTVAAVPQPVIISNRLHNVPKAEIWSFSPGNYFGIYRPDIFWLDPAPQ
ncbi:MAG TPA: ABC transporter substrate-binding protein [Dongiaceae bacterium]